MKVDCMRANSKQVVFLLFAIIGLIFMIVGTVICLKVFDYSDKVETTAIIQGYCDGIDSENTTNFYKWR